MTSTAAVTHRAVPDRAIRTAALNARHTTAFVAIFAMALTMPMWRDVCGLTPDSVSYLECARALRETGDYPPRQVVYPPAYPAVLALLTQSTETPWQAAIIVNSLCHALAAAFVFRLASRRTSTPLAFIAAACTAASPLLLGQIQYVRSEPPFTLLVVLALTAADGTRFESRTGRIVVLGAIVAAAALVRANGLLLVPAIVIAHGLGRRHDRLGARKAEPECGSTAHAGRLGHLPFRILNLFRISKFGFRASRLFWFTAVACAPIAAWLIHRAPYAPQQGYAYYLIHGRDSEPPASGVVELWTNRLTTFAPIRLRELAQCVVPEGLGWRLFQPPWDAFTTWCIGLPIALLLFVRALRGLDAAALFVCMNLPLLFIWPWDEGARLLAPLAPIVLVTLASYAGHGPKSEIRNLRFQISDFRSEISDFRFQISNFARQWRCPCCAAMGVLILIALALDLRHAYGNLPRQTARFRATITRAESIIDDWSRTLDPGQPWSATLRQDDGDKVAYLLAAYLSRRPGNLSEAPIHCPQ